MLSISVLLSEFCSLPQSLSRPVTSSTPFTCVHLSSAALIHQSLSPQYLVSMLFHSTCQILTVTPSLALPSSLWLLLSVEFSQRFILFSRVLRFMYFWLAVHLFTINSSVSFLPTGSRSCLHLGPPSSPPSLTRDTQSSEDLGGRSDVQYT